MLGGVVRESGTFRAGHGRGKHSTHTGQGRHMEGLPQAGSCGRIPTAL